MSESDKPAEVGAVKRISRVALTASKVFIGIAGFFIVIAGIGLLLNIVSTTAQLLFSRLTGIVADAMSGLTKDFLLWWSTNPTVDLIEEIGGESTGALTIISLILGIISLILGIVFYFLSRIRSNTRLN